MTTGVHSSARRLAALALAVGALSAGSAGAAKPEWAGHGGGKPGHGAQDERGRPGKDREPEPTLGALGSLGTFGAAVRFGDSQRLAVRDYFAPQIRAGKCPPGLAKKGNGCLPPGQAKKWGMGQPLPPGLTTYPLPRDLEHRLGVPPSGHQYVRVAGDILLIAIGTGLVIDAIEDLAGR